MNAQLITLTMDTCICKKKEKKNYGLWRYLHLHVFGDLDGAYRQGKIDRELRREISQD